MPYIYYIYIDFDKGRCGHWMGKWEIKNGEYELGME